MALDRRTRDPLASHSDASDAQALSREAALRRRWMLPSYGGSLLVHLLLLVLVIFLWQWVPQRTQAPGGPRTADVGIAIDATADVSGDAYYPEKGRTDTSQMAATVASPAKSVAEILSQDAAVDPSDYLPQTRPLLGAGSPGAGETGAASSAMDGPTGSGGAGTPIGKGGKARFFGTEGEGYKFVYVLDRSDSMGGPGLAPLEIVKAEVVRSLQTLTPSQQFQLVFYNYQPWVFNPSGRESGLALATDQNKRLAAERIGGLTAYGNTNHVEALKTAIALRPDVIFFLTDAAEPRMSAKQLHDVRRQAEGITINSIEVGYGPQRPGDNFLKRLAAENGGQYSYVDVTNVRPSAGAH